MAMTCLEKMTCLETLSGSCGVTAGLHDGGAALVVLEVRADLDFEVGEAFGEGFAAEAADFFVLPSQLEGMSCAIQEAMACGLPVIARRTGGNPELIEDGVTGLLCPPGAPDALGAALASLSHSPALRRRLGAAARQRAEAAFSLPAMVDAYAQLYRRTALAA